MTEIMRLSLVDVDWQIALGCQSGALGGEADFGKAKRCEIQEKREDSLVFQTGVGAELVGASPKAVFERSVGGVTFGWRDPKHGRDDATKCAGWQGGFVRQCVTGTDQLFAGCLDSLAKPEILGPKQNKAESRKPISACGI
jgi:hypothetical protein